MFEFKALDKWLDDWKQAKLEYLKKLWNAYTKWRIVKGKSEKDYTNRKELEIKDWTTTKGIYIQKLSKPFQL
jgi:hypothetical protein